MVAPGRRITIDLDKLPRYRNAAEFLHALGDIPLERIRFDPWPGTATEEDVLRLDDTGEAICELYDGILVEKTVGTNESRIAIEIGYLLMSHIKPRKLGIVLGADGMVRLFDDPDIRVPDVCFIGNDRLTEGKLPPSPPRVARIVPNLCVEVISKSNTQREMQRKLEDYFRAGVQLVWYVDPAHDTISVYTAVDQMKQLHVGDSLDGGECLPGFSAKVTDIFA